MRHLDIGGLFLKRAIGSTIYNVDEYMLNRLVLTKIFLQERTDLSG